MLGLYNLDSLNSIIAPFFKGRGRGTPPPGYTVYIDSDPPSLYRVNSISAVDTFEFYAESAGSLVFGSRSMLDLDIHD